LFLQSCRVVIYLTVSSHLATAHGSVPETLPANRQFNQPSIFQQLWSLPVLRFFAPAQLDPMEPLELTALLPNPPSPPPCLVEPLSPLADLEALEFENAVGSPAIVSTEGLTPGTARAFARFNRMVLSAGGMVTFTSAYRPAAYQEHLRSVWDKWMFELRDNHDDACQSLRAEVEHEFSSHQLLESQRPAVASDHTRGMAFDASVIMPSRRRKISIDRLARKVGLRRPNIAHDPVHFRFIG
jgi:hypothetical protein